MGFKITQAAAGTGKTTSLINEVYNFYFKFKKKNKRDPRVILTTFTRKATAELRERIVKRAVYDSKNDFLKFSLSKHNLHISTIHGVLSLFLKRFAHILGHDSKFKIEKNTKTLSLEILRNLLNTNSFLLEDYSVNELLKYCNKFYVEYFKNPNIKPASKRELTKIQDKEKYDFKDLSASSFEEISKIGQEFNKIGTLFSNKLFKEKTKKGIMTIDDLELITLKHIRENPKVATEFSNSWDYWLIDEYQDTSPLQEVILTKLISKKSGCYYVGDPMQSIYSFRNARTKVFFDKKKQIKNQITLKDNYRSNSALVSFINDFFDSYKDCNSEQVFEKMNSKSGRKIPNYPVCKFVLCSQEKPQEKALLTEIKSLLKKSVKPKDICVLSRENISLSKISKSLEQFNVPSKLHSSGAFFNRWEIIDLKLITKFILNPHDNLNTVSLLRSPWVGIEDKTIFDLSKTENKLSFWYSIKNNKIVLKLNDLLLNSKSFGVSKAIRNFCLENKFFDYHMALDKTGRSEANIWKFLLMLSEEEIDPKSNLLDFLDGNRSETSEDFGDTNLDAPPAFDTNMINLMTIHKAKGLEFKHVFLTFFDKPYIYRTEKNLTVDENLKSWTLPIKHNEVNKDSVLAKGVFNELDRISKSEIDRELYVALTRAIDSLHIFVNEEILKKENSYWNNKFDWNFSLGIHPKNNYSYEVSSAKIAETAYKAKSYLRKDTPDKFHLEKQLKISLGNFLNNKNKERTNIDILNQVSRSDFGTKFHRAMQALSQNPDFDIESFFDSKLDKKKVRSSLHFLKNLKEPPFMKILKNGISEWSFMTKTKNHVFEGRIDLFSIIDDTAWVVDYKTGRPNEADLKQLSIYSKAVSDVYKKKAKIVAIYPIEEKVLVKDSNFIKNTLFELGLTS